MSNANKVKGKPLETQIQQQGVAMETVPKASLPVRLKRGIPGNKRKIFISRLKEGGTVSTFGSWWDGGSKSDFCYIELSTGQKRPLLGFNPAPPQFGGKVQELELEPGWGVLETGYFCGKPSTPHIHMLDSDYESLGLPVTA